MPDFVLLIILGTIAGVMSGMFGIGGGAIIVPALILFMGFTQIAANGTSLAALLLPVGVFACIEYYKSGKLKIKPALLVAVGLAIASWFGASLALNLPAEQLKQAYGVFLLFIAWRYIAPFELLNELRGIKSTTVVKEQTELDFNNPRVLGLVLLIGVIAGLASGLFGIGGGVVIVPALMLLNFDQKLATGTSLGALLLPVGLPGVIRYAQDGNVDFGVAMPLAIMLMIGAIFGARLTLSLPTKTVRRLYGLFLLFIGLRFLFF